LSLTGIVRNSPEPRVYPLADRAVSILEKACSHRGWMAYSKIDWVVIWKLFHYQFCWIYLALGVPIRLILVRHFKTASVGKTILYVVVSSAISSLASTWFPVIPILAGALLTFVAGHSAGESLVISAPLVGVSLGIETSFIDGILLRLLLKSAINRRFVALLIANLVNATIAVALGLLWAFHRMPTFIAALN